MVAAMRRAIVMLLALSAVTAHVNVATLRLRGGMSSAAAQMAEIRAARAKQYEVQKKTDGQGTTVKGAAAEEDNFEGAQRVWRFATDKIGPSTIGTKKESMEQGDARNFYFQGEVTVLRNRKTGAVIELVHDSQGWLQFCPMEGGILQQISAKGDVLQVNRWYVAGLVEEIKHNPLKVDSIKAAGLRAGPWKIEVDGRRLVLTNSYTKDKAVHLTEDGFFYVNEGLKEGMRFQLSHEPDRMPLAEAQELIIGT